MKKILLVCSIILLSLTALCGCAKKVDYLSYVSEKRTNIYQYCNDGLEIKIYISEKETPYAADGIKGNVGNLTEVFVKLPENHEEVNVSVSNIAGEMNFRAVENDYYLSVSDGNVTGESAEVTLTFGGESNTYSAMSVLHGGVISCDDAVKCVLEHDGDLFASLTENNVFLGEIYVRLLYDEGCYYYVGVCDRDKKINAYLVDGERGKIIATKQMG